MAEAYRYAAFISYSSKDAAFARRLHAALERYGIPSSLGKFDLVGGGKKNRIYPVFRDREELSAGQLGEQIESRLRSSATLIVVCSPAAAASPWVQKEIEYFATQGRQSKIFAIVSDNAPIVGADGEDATASCFPPAFRGSALSGDKFEPLAADARRGKDGFRSAWLKVVAGMIGVSPGQIIDRDRRRRHAQSAIAAVMVAALAAVAVVAGGAYRQKERDVETLQIALLPAGQEVQDCASASECPTMIVLPAGRFVMGDNAHAYDDSREHEVEIGRFAVSRTEVTFAQWQACLDGGGCNGHQPNRNGWEGDDRPVLNVSWEDAQAYVQWLSQRTGHRYRLLTEAEWEFAARAKTTIDADAYREPYSWGGDIPRCDPAAVNGAAWACTPLGTMPVASFQPNAFGLFDMHGNVFEWVQDCFAPYDVNKADGVAVETDTGSVEAGEGAICSKRVLRGGHYAIPDIWGLSSSFRLGVPATARGPEAGFRVAMDVHAG